MREDRKKRPKYTIVIEGFGDKTKGFLYKHSPESAKLVPDLRLQVWLPFVYKLISGISERKGQSMTVQ
jgi:hypothetical protein